MTQTHDPVLRHGGALDAAIARFGGVRADWLDLSTGINPAPYPLPPLMAEDWTALPDRDAQQALIDAARSFWRSPVASGAGAFVDQFLAQPRRVSCRNFCSPVASIAGPFVSVSGDS